MCIDNMPQRGVATMQSRALQIESILEAYSTIANRDPHQLRSRIPSKEIWRFFVDGRRQGNCRNLKSHRLFKKNSRLNQFYSVDPLNNTINDYIEQIEKINSQDEDISNSELLMLLKHAGWTIHDNELNSLKLIDILNLDKAWVAFERTEPGYLKSLIQAFQLIFDTSIPVTSHFIKSLHQKAMKHVNSTEYNDKTLIKTEHDFRQYAVSFGLSIGNTTETGLYELFQDIDEKTLNSPNVDYFILLELPRKHGFVISTNKSLPVINELSRDKTYTNQQLYDIFSSFFLCLEGKLNKSHFAKALPFIRKLIKTSNNAEIAACLYQAIKESYSFCFFSQQNKSTQSQLNQLMETLINDYRHNILLADTALSKLEAIIDLVQACEQLHPFSDGNCRTFCMLLLNHLLIKNGFPLAILDDPNRFDMHSKDELLDEVIHGMQNTIDLIRNGKLYNIKTDDVLTYLKSKAVLNPEVTYFNDIVNTEETARNQFKKTIQLMQ